MIVASVRRGEKSALPVLFYGTGPRVGGGANESCSGGS